MEEEKESDYMRKVIGSLFDVGTASTRQSTVSHRNRRWELIMPKRKIVKNYKVNWTKSSGSSPRKINVVFKLIIVKDISGFD